MMESNIKVFISCLLIVLQNYIVYSYSVYPNAASKAIFQNNQQAQVEHLPFPAGVPMAGSVPLLSPFSYKQQEPPKRLSTYYQSLVNNYPRHGLNQLKGKSLPWTGSMTVQGGIPYMRVPDSRLMSSAQIEQPIYPLYEDPVDENIVDYYDDMIIDPGETDMYDEDGGSFSSDKWFDGPVYTDKEVIGTSEELTNAALNNMMMNYLLKELEKSSGKEYPGLAQKRQEMSSTATNKKRTLISPQGIAIPKAMETTTVQPIGSSPSTPKSSSLPSSRRIVPARILERRGQKEVPLLRPPSEGAKEEEIGKPSSTEHQPAWPRELEVNSMGKTSEVI